MEIGAWGDSITYGACDSEALGWVGRILKSFSIDDDVSVYNRGICGDTTEDLLARFEVEAKSIKPNVIIFAIGINDSKYPVGSEENRVIPDKFKKNMQVLVERARMYTDKIFIIGSTKVDESAIESTVSRFTNEQIKLYNNLLKECAKNESLSFVDVFNVLDKSDLCDGLHPNAQGYEKLAQSIGVALK